MRPLVMIALSAALLAGCASAPPVPPDLYYNFNVPDATAQATVTTRIVIEPFAANGVYGERPLIYREGEALSQYPDHFWSEPPSLALNDALVKYLRSAGYTETYTPLARANPDVVVRCRVRNLELVRGAVPKTVLSLEFLITQVRDNRVSALDFTRESPTEDSPSGHAKATSQLLGQAFAALAQALPTP